MSQTSLRVAVLTHHQLERAALAALVGQLPGLEVVPLDADPPPTVVICDTAPDGITVALPVNQCPAVLLLTTNSAGQKFPPGVLGMLSKDEGPEGLANAIRQVARGEQYLSPSLVPALLEQLAARTVPAPADLAALTEREREIMALLGEGLSNKAIAARLYLSVRTVEGHLARLYARLGIHTRTEAALIALQHGLGPQIR